MTTPQWRSIALLAAMVVAFIRGKFRYDVVALLSLLVGLLGTPLILWPWPLR